MSKKKKKKKKKRREKNTDNKPCTLISIIIFIQSAKYSHLSNTAHHNVCMALKMRKEIFLECFSFHAIIIHVIWIKKAKVKNRRMMKLLETFVCKLNACYRLPTSHLIFVSNIIILCRNLNTKKLWDRKKYVLRILVIRHE